MADFGWREEGRRTEWEDRSSEWSSHGVGRGVVVARSHGGVGRSEIEREREGEGGSSKVFRDWFKFGGNFSPKFESHWMQLVTKVGRVAFSKRKTSTYTLACVLG
jgi:hypothetical protein